MLALTCQGFDARALEQPGRAVVVVQVLVEVEAGVDAAVLLRDLHIVKVCGGSHGGGQRGERVSVLRSSGWKDESETQEKKN